MTQHGMEVIDHTVQLTNTWLKELGEAMGWQDRHRSYRLLRAALHTLRDWLPANDNAHLSAQLPMLIRGLYYEAWRPAQVPAKPRSREAFLGRIDQAFAPDRLDDTGAATTAVFDLLNRHLADGEIEHVRHALPADVRTLWP